MGNKIMNNVKWFVWGCGKIANAMMERMALFENNIPAHLKIYPKIDAFIDRDPTKQGSIFFGVNVYSPEYLENVNSDFVLVIGTKYYVEIEKWIQEKRIEKCLRVIRSADLMYEMQSEIINYADDILECDKLNDDNLRKCIELGRVFKINRGDATNYEKLLPVDIVTALYFICVDRTDELLRQLQNISFPKRKSRKIKSVGLICSCLNMGGAERVTSVLANKLASIGYNVVIITESKEDVEFFLTQEVKREVIPYNFNWDMYKYLKEYERIIYTYGIDCVCFHIPYEGNEYFYKLLFFKFCGLKLITQMHTSVANFINRWDGIAMHDKIYGFNDQLVVLSKADSDFWEMYGLKSKYIPNPAEDSLRQAYILRNNVAKRILWVGRVSQSVKQVQDAVIIFEMVSEKVSNAELFIVGGASDEREETELRKLIEKLKLDKKVHVCGYQKGVNDYYLNADIFLMTSPGEGFPMALLEAKAYSLPIVMYKLKYLELAKDDLGIVSTEQRAFVDAAEAIIKLCLDVKFYEKKSRESWDSVQKYITFDIAKEWDDMLGGLV